MARLLAAPEVKDRWSVIQTGVAILVIIGVATFFFGGSSVSPPGPVLLVGNSLFASASDELDAALSSDGWETRVEAVPGAGIEGGGFADFTWQHRLRSLTRSDSYDIAIVELGTNGCAGCESVRSAIDNLMSNLTEVDVVLWLNVRTEAPSPGEATAREINEELDAAQDRWSNLRVLPYDSWMDEPGLIESDGVHLTPEGRRALAMRLQMVLRGVADMGT